MPIFEIKISMEYPATTITEFVEVEAESLEQALELAEDGDGFLISEEIEYGDPASVTVFPATFGNEES